MFSIRLLPCTLILAPALALADVVPRADGRPTTTERVEAPSDPHLMANSRWLRAFPSPAPQEPSLNWITARLAEPGSDAASPHEIKVRWADLSALEPQGFVIHLNTGLKLTRKLSGFEVAGGLSIDGSGKSVDVYSGYRSEVAEVTAVAGVPCFRSGLMDEALQSSLVGAGECLSILWVRSVPYPMLATVAPASAEMPDLIAVAYLSFSGSENVKVFDVERDAIDLPTSLHDPIDFLTSPRIEMPFELLEDAAVRLSTFQYKNMDTGEWASVEEREEYWRLTTPSGGDDRGHIADFFIDPDRIRCAENDEYVRCVYNVGWRESGRVYPLSIDAREFSFSQRDQLFERETDGTLSPAGFCRDGACALYRFEQPL